jgi:hypothetical protein
MRARLQFFYAARLGSGGIFDRLRLIQHGQIPGALQKPLGALEQTVGNEHGIIAV